MKVLFAAAGLKTNLVLNLVTETERRNVDLTVCIWGDSLRPWFRTKRMCAHRHEYGNESPIVSQKSDKRSIAS